jgi:hypothetical protein
MKKIFEEEWVGAQLITIEHDWINLDQAFTALDRLDGKERTLLELSASGDSVMTVGGGGTNFVVSAAYEVDAELYTLIDLEKSPDNYENVVTGGQLGSFPANQVVTKSMVREAISYFYRNGKISTNQHWQRE